MGEWTPIPGETLIDDLSGLKDKNITTRQQLGKAEARNIRSATIKYLAAPPSEQSAPFDLAWVKKLHAEMFGQVWDWGGKLRRTQTNIGVAPLRDRDRPGRGGHVVFELTRHGAYFRFR